MKFITQPAVLSTSAADLLPRKTGSLSFRFRQAARLGTAAAVVAGLLGTGTPALQAATTTWTGGGGNPFWSTAGNWTGGSPGAATEDDVIFPGGALQPTNTLDYVTGFGVRSITFNAGAPSYVLLGTGGGTSELILDVGGITNNSTALQTLSFQDVAPGFGGIFLFNYAAGNTTETWRAAAGDLLVTSTVTFGGILTLIIDDAHNTTITGVINDSGVPQIAQLIKNGSGTLTLTGQNTYLGNTTVNGGLLRVDGSIASLQTFVTPGGTLGGRGVIGGNLYNNGNVAPGDSPGTLTVKGNYFQTKGGTLTIEIAGTKAGQFDVLAVQGAANIDGNLRLVQVGKAPRLKVGQRIDFLVANGGVNGTFSSVSNPLSTGTIVQEKVIYRANTVSLEGVQGSFAALSGLTPNQRAVAGGLDHVAFRNKQPRLIGYLDNEPLNRLPSDFDRISPDQLTSIFTLGVAQANVQTANTQRRTDDIRSGSNGFSAAGFQSAGSGPLYSGTLGVAGPSGDDGKESKEMKAVAPVDNRWGAFITGVGEWVNVNGDGNGRGYNLTSGGFTLGADYKLTQNFALGLSAGYTGTSSDLANGGRIFVNGGKLGLYSTYFTGGFYIDTAVNGGYNSYDTRRSGLQGSVRGDTDGGELNTLFATGYDFKVGGWSIGPTASFQYTYLGIDGYSEHGSLAPLTFRSQGQDSLRTAVGFKTSYDWRVGGVVIKPELRAAWQHEYGDNGYAMDSSFSNGNGNLFTVHGPTFGRDSLLVGAGFAIMWNERTSTYVYYDGELARTRYDAQNVSGGVRISF